MDDIQNRFTKLGLFLPEILLPNPAIELEKWAVIACDQFTQHRWYWKNVENAINGAPSTLNLIFPEIFLFDEDRCVRIDAIHRTMEQYLAGNVFSDARRGCVYVERSTTYNACRRGLVIAVDLEHYDWSPHARPLIRSTEGTVTERLPPRMDIRRDSALETTHVLILIDDEQDRLLPALAERAKRREPVYHSRLMPDSGDISGWFVDSPDDWAFIAGELEELARLASTRFGSVGAEKIAANSAPGVAEPFLFAVGDGNHSLAAAKEIWEEYKKNHPAGISSDGIPVHPCRYALVEIENLYDPAVQFEPIHRIVFDVQPSELLDALASVKNINCVQEQSNNRVIRIENLSPHITTASLQPLLDRFVMQKGCSIDYIHGEDEVLRIAADNERQAVGLILPPVRKDGLFKTVAKSGPLPQKSFSMGKADEKRFYLECRKLFG